MHCVHVPEKSLHLGYFPTEEAAARAYDREAIRIRGPSTRLNFHASDYGVCLRASLCVLAWIHMLQEMESATESMHTCTCCSCAVMTDYGYHACR